MRRRLITIVRRAVAQRRQSRLGWGSIILMGVLGISQVFPSAFYPTPVIAGRDERPVTEEQTEEQTREGCCVVGVPGR